MTTRGSLDDCLYEMAVPKVPHFDRPALNHSNVYAAMQNSSRDRVTRLGPGNRSHSFDEGQFKLLEVTMMGALGGIMGMMSSVAYVINWLVF